MSIKAFLHHHLRVNSFANSSLALTIESPDPQRDRPYTLLTAALFRKMLTIKLPAWILPERPSTITFANGDKDTCLFRRKYGFSVCWSFLTIYYGRLAASTAIQQSYLSQIPWLASTEYKTRFFEGTSQTQVQEVFAYEGYQEKDRVVERLPKVCFSFTKRNGTPAYVECYMYDCIYQRGCGCFRWLRYLMPVKRVRRLNMKFDNSVEAQWGSFTNGSSNTNIPLPIQQDLVNGFLAYAGEQGYQNVQQLTQANHPHESEKEAV